MWRRIVYFWLAILVTIPAVSSAAAAQSLARRVCGSEPTGYARCHALILSDPGGATPLAAGAPKGYGPADFRAAYSVVTRSAPHVAVVAAYDAPTIQADLTTYSKTFGLPVLPTCTTAAQSACFEKLDQSGGRNYPTVNASWAVEASLDAESVHAMCPGCRLSLVEARSPSMANLATAAGTAVKIGAAVVSNSYGGTESPAQIRYDSIYGHVTTTMVVSSGDSGYGTSYPATAPGVVAVGGTTLSMRSGRVSSETAWQGAGSGCSFYEPKPQWQHDKKCARRSVADVAADADPATGAAIYDSYPVSGRSGWFTVGGTSLAAPLVAGILASSGNFANQPAVLYSHSSLLRDIIAGNNGSCLSYYCQAGNGYDGPTGLGVPNHL